MPGPSERRIENDTHLGRKTVASVGLLTSLAMLAMMTQVLRLMGVSPCLIPRISRGTMMARAGESTACREGIGWQCHGMKMGIIVSP